MDDDEHARALVDRARGGDDNAARQLIHQLYPLVAKIVRGERRFGGKVVGKFKPSEGLVIDMLYLQERSVAEVQKLTGWTAATIKVRAFRARQKLRKQIGGLL